MSRLLLLGLVWNSWHAGSEAKQHSYLQGCPSVLQLPASPATDLISQGFASRLVSVSGLVPWLQGLWWREATMGKHFVGMLRSIWFENLTTVHHQFIWVEFLWCKLFQFALWIDSNVMGTHFTNQFLVSHRNDCTKPSSPPVVWQLWLFVALTPFTPRWSIQKYCFKDISFFLS